jgi:hypothetical protein
MRKPRWYDQLQYIILYALGFVIIGFASLMTNEVGFQGLKEPGFYISQVLTYVAIICIIIATLLKIIDHFMFTDPEYLESEKKIAEFANQYIPVLFARYSDYVNPTRKQKQFVANVKHEIRLILKGKKFLGIPWLVYGKPKPEDLTIWTEGTLEEKKQNPFCLQIATLEVQLTEKWIKEHINSIEVSYDEITLDVVLGGYASTGDTDHANDYVTKNKGWKLFKDKAPMILFSFGFSTFAGAIVVDLVLNETAWLNIVVKTMVLLYNTMMTVRYAHGWTQRVTLKDIRFRRGITLEYYKWVEQEAHKKPAVNPEEVLKAAEEAKKAAVPAVIQLPHTENKEVKPDGHNQTLNGNLVGSQ